MFSLMVDTDDSQGCKERENILIIIVFFLEIHIIARLIYDKIYATFKISIWLWVLSSMLSISNK